VVLFRDAGAPQEGRGRMLLHSRIELLLSVAAVQPETPDPDQEAGKRNEESVEWKGPSASTRRWYNADKFVGNTLNGSGQCRWHARFSWCRRPAGDFSAINTLQNRRRDAGATTPHFHSIKYLQDSVSCMRFVEVAGYFLE
jgi:hypothetical protein